jgi:hypothetical protein
MHNKLDFVRVKLTHKCQWQEVKLHRILKVKVYFYLGLGGPGYDDNRYKDCKSETLLQKKKRKAKVKVHFYYSSVSAYNWFLKVFTYSVFKYSAPFSSV